MYTAKVAVCSEIRTKHSIKSEHHVEFLNIKPGGKKRNRYALEGQSTQTNEHLASNVW